MEFVVAIERVGNEGAVQQIGLNYAWNLRGMPFFDVGSVSVGYGAKLPARIQICRNQVSRGRLGSFER